MSSKRYNKLDFSRINFIVLVLALAFITLGSFIQSKFFYYGLLINEVFIFFIPAIFILRGSNYRDILKLNKISLKNVIRVVVIVMLAYPVIVLINGLFLEFLSNYIELKNYSLNMFKETQSFTVYIFYLALIPAICEETFFRGLIISAYDCIGQNFSIFLSALVFALMHFDIQNFVAPLLLGILFANIQEYSNSLYAAVLAHFVNNVIGILFSAQINQRLLKGLQDWSIVAKMGSMELFLIFLLILVSFVSLFFIRRIFKDIKREELYKNFGNNSSIGKVIDFNLKGFLPLILLVVVYVSYYIFVVK